MAIKRRTVTDGVFSQEMLTFDLANTTPEEYELFRQSLTALTQIARIEVLRKFIATTPKNDPAVKLRLDRMTEVIGQAEHARTEIALPLIETAEYLRREIMLLPSVRKGVKFSIGKPKDAFGKTTRYLREQRGPRETAQELWDRIAKGGIDDNERPVYVDGGVMCEKGTRDDDGFEKKISFRAFEKRLNRRK